MSGAEIVQVVASASELARISLQLFKFFQRVRDADNTAKESCQRLKELHRVVDGVELALRRRKDQVSHSKIKSGEEQVWVHVRSSIKGCHRILRKIRLEFTAFDVESNPSLFERAIRQIRFDVVRKEALLDQYSSLDTQIQMLQVNTQTLNTFIQIGTDDKIETRTSEILDAIARLQVLHEKGNSRLESLIQRRENNPAENAPAMHRLPSISIPIHNSQDIFDDQDSGPSDIDIMKGTLTSAWDLITTYEPGAESVAEHREFDSDSGLGDPVDDEEPDTNFKVTEKLGSSSPSARTGSLSRSSLSWPLQVLDGFVKQYQLRVQTALEKDHAHSAEEDQLKAMEYAEERWERYKVPFEKVHMQEQLALIYKQQSKHEEVFRVLTELLPKAGGPTASLTVENTKHYQMMAETYYELWTSKGREMDLENALTHASRAFIGRGQQEGIDENLKRESAELLADVYEARNKPVEAKVFRDMLPIPQPETPPLSPVDGSIEPEEDGVVSPPLPPDLDSNAELVPTIKSGNLIKLRTLLKHGEQHGDLDIERLGRHNRTPLMYAFKYSQDNESMPLALLEGGSKIDADDDEGRTVLHQAAARGQVAMIRLAIRRDAAKEAKDKNRLTPLLVAVKENHKDCKPAVAALLEAGADAKAKDKDGWTLLHHAAHNSVTGSQTDKSNALKVLDYLLTNCMDCDIEAKDRQGYSPLCWIAGSGNKTAVAILLNHNADANARNKIGRSPLYRAMHEQPDTSRHTEVISLLLEHGAVVNEEDHSPLDIKKFKYLLKPEKKDLRRYSESKMSIREIERAGSLSTILIGESCDSGGASPSSATPGKKTKRAGIFRNLFLKPFKEEP